MHENHLIHEKSPYLLQHAHNPVDWYPWGPEAFRVAKQNNLPIFLSIGYSTCHWCHVMEHESFEDEEVANLLNQQFIAIKVDREERPDIDTVYMEVCQSLTGSGGWPLTILMTPAQKPFFAGTYLPKHAQYGTAGLIELLQEVSKLWREQPEMLLHSSEQIAAELQERSAQFHRAAEPSLSLSDRAPITGSFRPPLWRIRGRAQISDVPQFALFASVCGADKKSQSARNGSPNARPHVSRRPL